MNLAKLMMNPLDQPFFFVSQHREKTYENRDDVQMRTHLVGNLGRICGVLSINELQDGDGDGEDCDDEGNIEVEDEILDEKMPRRHAIDIRSS